MPENLSVWLPTAVCLIGMLVIAPIVAAKVARAVIQRVIERLQTTLNELEDLLKVKRQELKTVEETYAEAYAMVKTTKAFELDPSLPHKLQQTILALRVAQLKHRYETTVEVMTDLQQRLADLRSGKAFSPFLAQNDGEVEDVIQKRLTSYGQELIKLEGEMERYTALLDQSEATE